MVQQIFVGFMIVLMATVAKAEYSTVDVLIKDCDDVLYEQNPSFDSGVCYGMVRSTIDMKEFLFAKHGGRMFCIPDNLGPLQVLDRVIERMRKFNKRIKKHHIFFIMKAMKAEFACLKSRVL